LHIVENSTQLRINRTDGVDDTWEFYSWNDGLNIYPVDAASTVWFGRDGQNTDVSLYNGRLAVNHTGAPPTGYAIYANGSIWAKAGAGDSGGLRLHMNSGINVSSNVMSFHTGQADGFSFNGNSDGADNNNQLVVIKADGKVGIGTTAPLADLHVQGNAVIGNIQTYETTNPANSGATLHVHNTADDGGDADGEVNFGDETQVIISTGAIAGGPQGYQGSLWFGTSDHPAGGNTLNSAGTQWNWKVAGIASKTDQDTASENSAYGNLEFYTKGSNASTSASLAMTIDESQNVGIGKTDPSAKLHTVKATSDTITADTAGVKFDGSGSDGLAFGNMTSAPHSSWIQAGYLANGYSPAFNSGYPIVLNPIGGNIGIGITNPSEELHIYDAGSDPYVLVDGSGSNRDSGYKINAGNGVKIAARADAGGNMYFADNAILVGSSNGNGQYRSVKIDSEIVLRENSGTNPSEAIIARMLGCRDIAGAGGSAILGGQGDTLSGHALRKNGSTGTNTFFFGPYGTFPAGSFTALFRIKIGLINSGSIGQIDVTGSGTANASGANVTNRSRSVNTSDFINGQYMYFPVDFDRTSSGGGIEFRWLNANSNADVYLDHILIVPRITR
jgi:hypothetical protein